MRERKKQVWKKDTEGVTERERLKKRDRRGRKKERKRDKRWKTERDRGERKIKREI